MDIDRYVKKDALERCQWVTRAASFAPILPRVMKEEESKKAALILMKH